MAKYWKEGFHLEPAAGRIEISDQYWEELLDGQAAGKAIVEDADGFPVLCDPEPEPENYEQRVEELIRARYTVSDELALLRQRDTKQEEFARYTDFCETCKQAAKQ